MLMMQEAPAPFTSYLPMRRTLSERMSPGSAAGTAAGISVLLRDSLSASSALGPLTVAERDKLHVANASLLSGSPAEPPVRRRSEPSSQRPVSSSDVSREGVCSAGDARGSASAMAAVEPRHHCGDSDLTGDRKADRLSYDVDEVMAILEGAAGQGVCRPSSSSDGREGAAAPLWREGAWRGGWQASGIRLLGGQRNDGGGPPLYGRPAGQGSPLVGGSGPNSRPLKPYKPPSAAGQRVRSADGGLH